MTLRKIAYGREIVFWEHFIHVACFHYILDAYRYNGSVLQRHNHFLLIEVEEIELHKEENPSLFVEKVPPPPRYRNQR